jgi:hypothetical protein
MGKTKRRNTKKRNTKRRNKRGGGITEKESTRFEYMLYPSYLTEAGKPRKIRMITKLQKNYPRPYLLNMIKSNTEDVDDFLRAVVDAKNPPVIYRGVQDIEPVISGEPIKQESPEEKEDDKTKLERIKQEFDQLKEEYERIKKENEELKK